MDNQIIRKYMRKFIKKCKKIFVTKVKSSNFAIELMMRFSHIQLVGY